MTTAVSMSRGGDRALLAWGEAGLAGAAMEGRRGARGSRHDMMLANSDIFSTPMRQRLLNGRSFRRSRPETRQAAMRAGKASFGGLEVGAGPQARRALAEMRCGPRAGPGLRRVSEPCPSIGRSRYKRPRVVKDRSVWVLASPRRFPACTEHAASMCPACGQ